MTVSVRTFHKTRNGNWTQRCFTTYLPFGNPDYRALHYLLEQEMSSLLLQERPVETVSGRCSHSLMGQGPFILLSPISFTIQDPVDNTMRQSKGYFDCPLLAKVRLVPLPGTDGSMSSGLSSAHSQNDFLKTTDSSFTPTCGSFISRLDSFLVPILSGRMVWQGVST